MLRRPKRSKNEAVVPKEEESGWGVAMTTHMPLVLRLKKE
jgi:broad specificity polyphosphatase/5'/3'-nucleotidase SurE